MKIKENAGAYAAPELKETVVSVENGFATSGFGDPGHPGDNLSSDGNEYDL